MYISSSRDTSCRNGLFAQCVTCFSSRTLKTCHPLFFSSRKNPIHFQECSHPGDMDYEEEDEETDEADRPECPYGTDCYRSVVTISVMEGGEWKA